MRPSPPRPEATRLARPAAVTEPRPAKLEAYRDPAYAERYDERWSSRSGSRRDARKAAAIRRAWASLCEATGSEPRRALDVPFGTGRFAELLRELCPGTVLGADLSAAMLDEALRKHPRAAVCIADAARLPLRDDAVDVVLCIRFLHLVRERELRLAFLRELARVARLGVIVDYRHGHTLRNWGRRLRHRVGLLPSAPIHPSPAAIRAELADAGLRLVSRHPVRALPLASDKLLHVARP